MCYKQLDEGNGFRVWGTFPGVLTADGLSYIRKGDVGYWEIDVSKSGPKKTIRLKL